MKRVKIEQLSQSRLKIILSCTEILQMNAQVHPVETSELFIKLITTIDKKYHFSVMNYKILMEMIPSVEDGFHIYLTLLSPIEKSTQETKDTLIFSFMSFDDAVDGIKLLPLHFKGTYSLFLLDEKYYLVIYDNASSNQKTKNRLSDHGFCIESPGYFEGILLEYGKIVACQKTFLSLL